MKKRVLVFVVFVLIVLSGCTTEERPTTTCTINAECSSTEECMDGYCRVSLDYTCKEIENRIVLTWPDGYTREYLDRCYFKDLNPGDPGYDTGMTHHSCTVDAGGFYVHNEAPEICSLGCVDGGSAGDYCQTPFECGNALCEVGENVQNCLEDCGNTGTILGFEGDGFMYEPVKALSPDMFIDSDGSFIIVHEGDTTTNPRGLVDVVTLTDNVWNKKDSFTFSSLCLDPSIFEIDDEYYGVAYEGPGNDGWIKFFKAGFDGLDETLVGSYEFDGDLAKDVEVVKLSEGIFAAFYRGSGGEVTTFSLDTSNPQWIYKTHSEEQELQGSEQGVDLLYTTLDYKPTFDYILDSAILTINCVGDLGLDDEGHDFDERMDIYIGGESVGIFNLPWDNCVYLDEYALTLDVKKYMQDNGNLPALTLDGTLDVKDPYGDCNDFVAKCKVKLDVIEKTPEPRGAFIDSGQFEAHAINDPQPIKVGPDIYAIYYYDTSLLKTVIATVRVGSDGSISDSLIINKVILDGVSRNGFDIENVQGDIYLLTEKSLNFKIRTIQITSDGIININLNNNLLELDGGFDSTDLVRLKDGWYAVIFSDADLNGGIRTFRIAPDGSIFQSVIGEVYYGEKVRQPRMLSLKNNDYLLTYSSALDFGDDGSDGWLKVIKIASSGISTGNYVCGDGTCDSFYGETSLNCYQDCGYVCGDGMCSIPLEDQYKCEEDCIDPIICGDGICGTSETLDSCEQDCFADITASLIFEEGICVNPDAIRINNEIYAVAYHDAYKGILKTVSLVDGSEKIIDSEIYDELTVYNDINKESKIVHINGDIYAVAYSNSNDKGKIKTFSITSSGTITPIATFELETLVSVSPDVLPLSNNLYAVAYASKTESLEGFCESCCDVYDGRVEIVSISLDGSTIQRKSTLNFDTRAICSPDLVKLSDTTFAVAYEGFDEDGTVKTFEISNLGTTINERTSYVFDSVVVANPEIINLGTGTYAIAYQQTSKGMLKTLIIGSDGSSISEIESSLFAPYLAKYPQIINMAFDRYAMVYTGLGQDTSGNLDDGEVLYLDITNTGMIGSVLKSSIFGSQIFNPKIIKSSDPEKYVSVYTTGSQHGEISKMRLCALDVCS